ncbi:MAG: N-acetyltransferase [Evtepia sp.]|nr:N-acetyltransferase [Evtepia sp.]
MEFIYEQERIYMLDSDDKLIAEVTFPTLNGVANIEHTFVDSSLRGQGVASKLMEATANQIRSSELKAKLTCSYAIQWFPNHPEYSNLLD